MIQRIRQELRDFAGDRLTIGPAIILTATGLCLWAYEYFGASGFFVGTISRWLLPDASARTIEAASYLYWFASAFPILVILPTLIGLGAFKLDPEHTSNRYGWGVGDWRVGLGIAGLFYLVMVPILATVVFTNDFQDYYPIYSDADRTWRMFAIYEACYFLYFVGWEYFFRGFMTFSLAKSLGPWAVFVQMLPFTIMHFGKPALEAASAVFGGLALGWLAWRTKSFWYGVIVHGLTAVTLDLMVVASKHWHK